MSIGKALMSIGDDIMANYRMKQQGKIDEEREARRFDNEMKKIELLERLRQQSAMEQEYMKRLYEQEDRAALERSHEYQAELDRKRKREEAELDNMKAQAEQRRAMAEKYRRSPTPRDSSQRPSKENPLAARARSLYQSGMQFFGD